MVLFTGVTVEEAIEQGLATLGLSRSQAQITILAKEKKGFLGFGKKLAQVELVAREKVAEPVPAVTEVVEDDLEVLVEPVAESTEAELVEPVSEEEPVPVAQAETAAEPAAEPELLVLGQDPLETELVAEDAPQPISQDDFAAFVAKEFTEPRLTIEEACAEVTNYIEKIIYEMDLEATITSQLSRRHMTLQIETPEPGRIIGYHGKVLKSLQLLAQNFLHDRYSRHFSVAINVRDYLENRTETLIDMATRAAHRVLDTGKPYRLDPMTNQERKTIHKTVSRISGVESYSEGDDPDRYVVIVSRD